MMGTGLNKLKGIHLFTKEILERFTIRNTRIRSIVHAGFFLLAINCLYGYLGIYKYIQKRPGSLHMSAQAQRASIALNYYRADMNFFKPRIQRYLKGEGITGVEFPIIYYSAAILYKMFGFNEVYLRSISLILFTIGIFFFYLLMNAYVKSRIIAFLLTLPVILSPVLLFYTPNFLPDAPSLGLQLASWYFFFNYLNSNKVKQLNWFVFFVTLAALIKSISIMAFMVVICLLILDRLKAFRTLGKERLIAEPGKIILRICCGLLAVISWYMYAHWLSVHYDYVSFALRPVIVDDWNVAKDIFTVIRNLWVNHYFAYESYVIFVVAFALIFSLFKFANRLLLWITILYFLGSVCYVYLFFNQFKWHDYYIIAILPTFFFIMFTFGEMIVRFAANYFMPLQFVFIVILFFNIKESSIYCEASYTERNTPVIYYWTGDFRSYEDLEPKLRKAGVKRTDKFASAFDETYCGSLYLMDQIGITIGSETSLEDINSILNYKDVKYLVLNDSARFNKLYPNDLHKKVFMVHRGLIIYKLRQ